MAWKDKRPVVSVYVGGVFKANAVRSGNRANGNAWQLIVIYGRYNERMTIWVANPVVDIANDGLFKVTKILKAGCPHRRDKPFEPDFSVVAEVEPYTGKVTDNYTDDDYDATRDFFSWEQ